MRVLPVHIAGIGVSERTDATLDELAVSAGTKALLDAGVTYSDVDHSVACFLGEQLRIPQSCFNLFGMQGAPVCEVDNHSGLFTAVQCIRSRGSNCTLVIGLDQEASNSSKKTQVVAVGIILVSNLFLTSHAYLKDSAACILACSLAARAHSRSSGGPDESRTTKSALQVALRQAQLQPKDIQIMEVRQNTNSNIRQALSDFRVTQPQEPSQSLESFAGTTGLAGLCGLVWQLRGWVHDRPTSGARNCLQYTLSQDGAASIIVLCRSDGSAAPTWNEIEHARDGRERLGYNPAFEIRGVSREDLEAVRTREEFRSDDVVQRLQFPVKGGGHAALARL